MQFPQKIPTLIGLFLLVGIIGSIIGGVEFVSQLNTQAAATVIPSQIKISSITDTSAVITWLTDNEVTGFIELTSPKKQLFYDQRNTEGILDKNKTHFVSLTGLSPQTIYSFTINSQNKAFPQNNLSFRTHSTLSGGSGLEPAYGSIETTSGIPSAGAIIILTPVGGQPLAALVQPSGSWLISLNTARTADGNSYLNLTTDRLDEEINIDYPNSVTTALTDTLNDSPVPNIVIGKQYDFRREQGNNFEKTSFLAKSPDSSLAPSPLTIAQPRSNAALPTDLPLFQGTGIPGNSVTLTIGITHPFSESIKIDADGLWRYTPPKPLGAGKQSITASSKDKSGRPVALTHIFEIFKSGTQVLGDATPSATLSPQPSLTPTPIPTLINTPTPESTSDGQPMPVSGNELPTLIMLISGFILFTGGILFLL